MGLRGLPQMAVSRARRLLGTEFLRSVAVLTGGTASAQALPVLVMPVLTRLYTPDEFGALAVFAAVLGVLAVVVGGQYETAIPIPKEAATAANLLAVALGCAVFTTSLTTVAVVFFGTAFAGFVHQPALARHLWMLPIGVAGTGGYVILQFWAVRNRAFPRIARTRLSQAFGGSTTQLALGWGGAGTFGLIAGQIVTSCAGVVGLGRGALRDDRRALRQVSLAGMKQAAAQFVRFPLCTAPEAFANAASIQVPVLLVAQHSPAAEVGFLMLGLRLMQAPLALIGSSVSQVYYAHAVTEHREDRLAPFTADVLGKLIRVGVGPMIFAGLLAPSVCETVLGAGWHRAGVLIAWMTPWLVLQFVSSPVSQVLYVTSRQLTAMVIQMVGLALRIAMVLLAATAALGHHAAEGYALSGLVFYGVYLVVICRVAGVTPRMLATASRRGLTSSAWWVAAGIAAVLLIRGLR